MILDLDAVPPNGKWTPTVQNTPFGKALPGCLHHSDTPAFDGKYLALQFELGNSQTYLLPVSGERGLPELPQEGLVGTEV